MLRRLAAANPNNVKLEKFYSSIYRGPVLIQGDKKGDKKGDKFFIRVFIGDRGVFKDTSRSRGPVSHQGKKRTQPRSDDLSS